MANLMNRGKFIQHPLALNLKGAKNWFKIAG